MSHGMDSPLSTVSTVTAGAAAGAADGSGAAESAGAALVRRRCWRRRPGPAGPRSPNRPRPQGPRAGDVRARRSRRPRLRLSGDDAWVSDLCPCGLGDPYDACCGRLHRGEAFAATAEQLMRSRYSAFAVGDLDYLLAPWHPSTRPAELALDDELRWVRLDVQDVRGGGFLDATGEVEFDGPLPG